MICAISNSLRKPGGLLSVLGCQRLQLDVWTYARIVSAVCALPCANSWTYSIVDLYTLQSQHMFQLHRVVSLHLDTHLLSGGGGAPGACRDDSRMSLTSARLSGSPSTKSASE
jgi:hypothetical protein